jgi:hypothetical protein
VITQPPSSITAGAPFGFEVEAADRFGNLATGFTDSVTASLSGATLNGPLTATAQGGMASFAGLTLDQVGSDYTIQVGGGSLTGETTTAFNVTAASASQLVIWSQPPATISAGNPFGLAVTAEDPYGNTATSFNGSVTLALASNPGVSSLNGVLSAIASNGLATFSGLSLHTAASGYTIEAGSGGLSIATSNAINVAAAKATTLVVSIPPPTAMSAGAGFGLAIAAEDSYGNLATGFDGNITIALGNNPRGATLSGEPLTLAATAGIANFHAYLNLDTAASGYRIQATSDGLTPVTTGAITVTALRATHLVVVAEPPSPLVAGSPFGLVVAAEDPFGNIDLDFPGKVSVAPLGGSGVILGGTTTSTASNGVVSFSGLTLTPASAAVSLRVTGSGFADTTTSAISVTAPATLVIHKVHEPSTPPLVTVTSVQTVFNRKDQANEILVGFSGDVNAAEAQNTATYVVTMGGRGGSFTASNAKTIRLRSAVYDLTHHIVTLMLRKPFALSKPVRLVVNGVAPSGLEDRYGRLIDGNRDGKAGGNAVAVLGRNGMIRSAPKGSPFAVRNP